MTSGGVSVRSLEFPSVRKLESLRGHAATDSYSYTPNQWLDGPYSGVHPLVQSHVGSGAERKNRFPPYAGDSGPIRHESVHPCF